MDTLVVASIDDLGIRVETSTGATASTTAPEGRADTEDMLTTSTRPSFRISAASGGA